MYEGTSKLAKLANKQNGTRRNLRMPIEYLRISDEDYFHPSFCFMPSGFPVLRSI